MGDKSGGKPQASVLDRKLVLIMVSHVTII